MTSQREMLRLLFDRYGPDENKLIRAYAAAERRGEVKRTSNAHDFTPEEYATRLLADARQKGWIKGL